MKEFYESDLFDVWDVGALRTLNQSPTLNVYTDATITKNGCVSSDGKIIEESIHIRGANRPVSGKPSPSVKVTHTSERAYYFGYSNSSHWGHYLTETVARSGHLDIDPIDVYHCGDISRIKKLYPQHKYIHISNAVKCETLYVPVPTMVNLWNIFPEHIKVCQKIGDIYGRDFLPNKRVYLSRTTQPKHRRWTEGEPELEELLSTAGWKIVHCAHLSPREQIGYIENAQYLTGCIGSSFHNLMMTRQNPGKVVYLTCDIDNTNPNYALHDRILGNDSVYLDCQVVSNPSNRTKKILNPIEVFEYLQDTCI